MSYPTPNVTRIGVVTPSLNGETYLKQALESIWSQASETMRIDHVLVDGGSTDATLEIASGYPTRTVVSSDDQGM
ncbi:MAG: glycosyltransferase, partial [Actinomycetota bacterium]|nr:glycosyltransferase [Actinomycetota bacterium]